MKAVGIRIEFVKQKWPDLLKMGKAGQLQMWRVGWIKRTRKATRSRSCSTARTSARRTRALSTCPSTTTLYRQSRMLPDGAERNMLYRRMSELVAAYKPWALHVYTVETTLVQPWVRGYKKHAYWEHPWLYLDVDSAQLAAR